MATNNFNLPSTSTSPQNQIAPGVPQDAPPPLPLDQANLDRIQGRADRIARLGEMYLQISEAEEDFMISHRARLEAAENKEEEDGPSDDDKARYADLVQRKLDRQTLDNLTREVRQEEMEIKFLRNLQFLQDRIANLESEKEGFLTKSITKITKKIDDETGLTGTRPRRAQADPTVKTREVFNIYDQTIGDIHTCFNPAIAAEDRNKLYEQIQLKDNNDMYVAMNKEFYDKIDRIPKEVENKAFETIKSINAGSMVKDARYPVPEFGTQDYIKEGGMKYIFHTLRNRYYKTPNDHTIPPSKLVGLHRMIVEHLGLDATQAIEVFYMFFRHGPILTILTDIAEDGIPGTQLVRTLYDTILNYERYDNPTGVRVKLHGLVSNIGRRPLTDTLTDIQGTCLKLYDTTP